VAGPSTGWEADRYRRAAISSSNVRLFDEVEARRDLTALGEVGRAVSSTLDLKIVLKTIELSGTDAGSIY
jgi:hypothetical protein